MDREILLLHRQPAAARAALAALRTQSHGIRHAETAAEAATLIRERPPHLVIVDLAADDPGGIDLCRQLRRISEAAILILAGRRDQELCIGALRSGADDYMSSPIEMGEFLARVDALLRRVSPSYASVLEVGNVRIDLATRDVTIAGRRLHLRPKEFSLLAHLLRRPSEVHTHRALLSALWGPAMQLRPHYVRMCVAHLRQRIEPDPSEPRYVVTERGVGYCLRPGGDPQVASRHAVACSG